MPDIYRSGYYVQTAACRSCGLEQEPDNLFADCAECGHEYCAYCGHLGRKLCESCNHQFEADLEAREWEKEDATLQNV